MPGFCQDQPEKSLFASSGLRGPQDPSNSGGLQAEPSFLGQPAPTRHTDWITHLTRPAPGTVTKGHGVSCPNSSWNGASCFEGSQGPPLLIAGDFLKGIGQLLPGSSPEHTSKKLPEAQTLRRAGKVHGHPPSPTHPSKLISLARVGSRACQ